ncbi:hypothetical protein EYZ11_011485 [Aspergillus tanneri]|uniref:Uncharacterized protein n=1 Tax=Aspergillus tanneri TaxID=1220188 RepID=A0A4S3J4U0_9EURO|nr:hypothetical protein EYZ11_011485 [Aspergillus tanneri]
MALNIAITTYYLHLK